MNSPNSDSEPLSIQVIISDIINEIENNVPVAKERLIDFQESFINEFSSEEKNFDKDKTYGEVILWSMMDGPLLLYSFQMNGSLIIDLYSILERFILRDLVKIISRKGMNDIIETAIERKTLPELGKMLRTITIIDQADERFLIRITKLRNGIAHRNPKIISNLLQSGKRISILDLDSIVGKIDCKEYIFHSIRILIKLIKASEQ